MLYIAPNILSIDKINNLTKIIESCILHIINQRLLRPVSFTGVGVDWKKATSSQNKNNTRP